MSVLADSTSYVDWPSMWKILGISIAAGAGLVTVYSVGLLALSASGYLRGANTNTVSHTGSHAVGSEGTGSDTAVATPRRHVVPLIAAVICLAIVVAAAAYGIHVMLAKG